MFISFLKEIMKENLNSDESMPHRDFIFKRTNKPIYKQQVLSKINASVLSQHSSHFIGFMYIFAYILVIHF